MNKKVYIIMLLLAVVTLSCSKDDEQPAVTPPESQDTGNLYSSELEIPEVSNGSRYKKIVHKILLGRDSVVNYTVEYDLHKYIPHWVAFKFYSGINGGTTNRSNQWANDPFVPTSFWVEQRDFSPYERGHMLASADRKYSAKANEQTFYYSNMCPQVGVGFNEDIWAALESQVRVWRNNFDTLYVVRGPIYNDATPCTGYGTKHIPIATHFYMALLGRNQDSFQAIAICLEHKSYGDNGQNFATYKSTIKKAAITIDELEEKAKIDLFPNLPDKLETTVESVKFDANWGL